MLCLSICYVLLAIINLVIVLHAVVSPPVVIYMGKDKYESEMDTLG